MPSSSCLRLVLGLALGVCTGALGAQEHWAFRPLRAVQVPEPEDAAWARNEVDRFVLSKQRAAGLQPAPAAATGVLVRRLYFDLIGMPPPADRELPKDEAGLDALIDELLASRRFAERWGRHWLDVARFAESSGGGRSLMFPDAWRYRDYVIEAFHVDRPYDQFVREQLAGDLLEYEGPEQRNRQLIATGFLELGPTNYELQDKELLRMEVIDEQIDTMGRAFMGMTLGCARCHDHKFDPVPTTDYYALAGIFGSTEVLTPSNVSGWVRRRLLGPEAERWAAQQARRKQLRAEITRLKGDTSGAPLDAAQLQGIVLDDEDAEFVGRWVKSKAVPGALGGSYRHDDNELKGRKSVRFVPDIPEAGEYELRISFTTGSNRATAVPVEIVHAAGTDRVEVDQRRGLPTRVGFYSLGRYRFEAGKAGSITLRTVLTDGHVIVDALHLLPAEATQPKTNPTQRRRRLAKLRRELAALDKRTPKQAPMAMAVRDAAAPADGHVHIRGLVRKRGPVQARGFLTACGNARPEIPAGQSGRKQLAAWLVDPRHPLTARVYVNRIWHHLFGRGIVSTPDNFGTTGARPSHPELLDWLAARFIAEDWSTKRLIRLLLRSATYRQAARGNGPKSDPDNRWLAGMRRRRLDAEALRDAVLAISGELELKEGGATIRKVKTYDYDYHFESRRRSVYVPRFRGTSLPLFEVFDAADPNLVTGARNVSNVAPQALYLMNSPWIMARARATAARVLRKPARARLDWTYRLVLGRLPSPAERRLAKGFLAAGVDEGAAWQQLIHALFACLDFRYLD